MGRAADSLRFWNMRQQGPDRGPWRRLYQDVFPPPTAVSVCEDAFSDQQSLASVKLNEGLRVLEYYCFRRTGIRRLALPASVREIQAYAFEQ